MFKHWGPAIVAVVAACIAGCIALRQWWTARDRLRFDMFEKAFCGVRVKKIINTATQHGGVTQEDLNAFYDGICGSEFLFDGNTRAFVMNIGQMIWRAKNARARRERSAHHPLTDKLIDEEENILTFLSEQGAELENMFSRYLDLSRIGLLQTSP
jgi:hypothetical protein